MEADLPIGQYPTRLYRHDKLSKALENNIFIKQEFAADHYGGGNKVRIIKQLMPMLVSERYSPVIVAGDTGSNCCMAVSNYANEYGIEAELVLTGNPHGRINLRDMMNSGARIHHIGDWNPERISRKSEELRLAAIKAGKKPYVLPAGMLGEHALLAGMALGSEILDQQERMRVKFDYVFLPVGTGGTLLGLTLSNINRNEGQWNIRGVSIANTEQYFSELLNAAPIKQAMDAIITKKPCVELTVDSRHIGGGYGQYTAQDIAAIRHIRQEYNIFLDVTYMHKCFKGMTDFIASDPSIKNKNILLIHTGAYNERFNEIYASRPS